MPTFLAFSRRDFAPIVCYAPMLLASTSIAALLIALPARAGQTITNQTIPSVTNPAGQTTTSIIIINSTVTGAVTNAGTISPGKMIGGGKTAAIGVASSTIGAGIMNTGAINVNGTGSAAAINVTNSSVAGGITNTGAITVTGNGPAAWHRRIRCNDRGRHLELRYHHGERAERNRRGRNCHCQWH